jgi:hypothetical protein
MSGRLNSMNQLRIRALLVATVLTLAFAAGANAQDINAPQPGFLIPVGTAAVPASTIPFAAHNWFIVNTEKNSPVNISFVGDAFKAQFLGKVEPPHTGSTLRCSKLVNPPALGLIVLELGGEEKAETTLAELFSLMKAQKKGENGPLLTDGYANIFFIKDVDGTLHTVNVDWRWRPPNYDDGWYVNAGAMTEPRWNLGVGRVCYRDSRVFTADANAQDTNAPQPGLLIPIGTTTVPATTIPFAAREWFIVNTEKNARVKISYLNNAFKAQFLGKVEPPHRGSTLRCAKRSLEATVRGTDIINTLGGREKAETTLEELFSLMEAQKNGEDGLLITDGYTNVFYIKDMDGTLRTVHTSWHNGWLVSANTLADQDGWASGRRFFSRDSH